MARKPTILDVARVAGVSTATVSRVINDDTPVTAKTRATVEDAIHTLGYRPNSLARGLVTGKTGVIGVLIPDVIGPLYGQITRGIEEVLLPLGIHNLVVSDNRSPENEKQVIDLLLKRQVDGLIIVGSYLTEDELSNIVPQNFPIVLLQPECVFSGNRFFQIEFDNASGVRAALEHLFEMGHRSIAHIAGVRRDGQERKDAFIDIMQDAELPVIIIESDGTEEGGLKAAKQLVNYPEVTAVHCNNDRTALGMYRGLNLLNKHIPKDISVIGFDDLSYCDYLDPPLSSTRQSGKDMGNHIAQQLLAVLNDVMDETFEKKKISSEFIQRASVNNLVNDFKGVVA